MLVRDGELNQMICSNSQNPAPAPMPPRVTSRLLTSADVPEMVTLAEITEPGPFRVRTIELGVFYGIFDSGRLVAMAGQRLHQPEFVEVSAVCTHPDARGRGYARALMSLVIEEMLQRGKTPILHTFADNYPAIRVYEGLGFTLRRTLHLAVLKNGA
jgi:predicted GNAT family acetyltransferase